MKVGLVKAFLYTKISKTMKNRLNTKNYIVIADWMLDLNLNARELLVYAIIYGFSQDGEGYYYGSFSYLAEWLGIRNSSQNVIRYLKPLVEKNLVVKKEGTSRLNQKLCLYRTVENKGKIINNPEVDYIIIQSWMLNSMHLNGKDLLLYALVHGYSRKDSTNVCNYDIKYFSKWLQCRKDHVGRQVEKALQKGLIKEVKEGSFVAVVPDEIKTSATYEPFDLDLVDPKQLDNIHMSVSPQTESTQPNDSPKLRVPSPQTESTFKPKLRDNNLVLDNLVDNLTINNNMNNANTLATDFGIVKSVVEQKNTKPSGDFYYEVNFDLISPNMESKEYTALLYKTDIDFELYQKYKTSDIDIVSIMRKLSSHLFRNILVSWPLPSETTKNIEDLILYVLSNKKFKARKEAINSLSNEQILQLFNAAVELYDPDNPRIIHKNKKAYMIGVVENILDHTSVW